jgi:predicted amidohydrolase
MMNQVWLVSANQVGRSSSPRAAYYYGHSRIVGPDGRIVAEIGLEEGLVVASADVKEGLHRTRSEDPIGHGRRRPELYGRITALD